MEDQVEIRAAKVEDFQELVEISKGIYFNTDYLALVYHHWLELERLDQLTNARLINLVLVHKSTHKVIGFQSIYIQENETALSMALRIDPQFRGQGLAKVFINLTNEYLRELNPNLLVSKCIIHPYNSMSVVKSSGIIFHKGNQVAFSLGRKDLETCLAVKDVDTLRSVSQQEFSLWINKEAQRGRYPEKFVYFEQVPYHMKCLANISLYNVSTNFLVSDDTSKAQSEFSICQDPFPVDAGIKTLISIYNNNVDSAKDHFQQQMRFLAQQIETRKLVDIELHIRLFVSASIGQQLLKEVLVESRLGKLYPINYTDDGEFASAYFVEDSLS